MIPSREYSMQLRTLMLAGRFLTVCMMTCLLSFVLVVLPLHNENAAAIAAALTMGSLALIVMLTVVMLCLACTKVVVQETKYWTTAKQLTLFFYPWWPWIMQRLHRGR